MGHERTGVLPKSKRWRDIVGQIGGSQGSDTAVSEVANETIENVRSRFRHIEQDTGVRAAFEFLTAFAAATRNPSLQAELSRRGISIPSNRTPLQLAKSLQDWVGNNRGSMEYSEIVQRAATDAIAIWFAENKTAQQPLIKFGADESAEIWQKVGTGAGFCELSRLFFGKFVERYLKYFLEREASSALPTVRERDEFNKNLTEHIDSISKHAFETAKITQSFAAGWFNRHASDNIPSQREIVNFLSLAFGKLREELSRETEK